MLIVLDFEFMNTITKEEEAAPIRPKMMNNKAKRERLPDWSDY